MISDMRELLVIEDGPRIRLEGRPAQGTRHQVLFGVMLNTAEPVVVKLERVPDALERERTALAWLTAERGPVPRLLLAGTATIGDERAACLVTERRPGSPPATTDGWRRMGRAYGRLSDFRHPADRLMTLDPIMFARRHAQRASDLGDRLAPVAASVPDWEHLVSQRFQDRRCLSSPMATLAPGTSSTMVMRGPSSTGKRLTSLPAALISRGWCSSLYLVPGQADTSHVTIENVPARRWTAIWVPCATAGGRLVTNLAGGRPSQGSNSSTAAGSYAADPHPGRTPRKCFGRLLPMISFGRVASREPSAAASAGRRID